MAASDSKAPLRTVKRVQFGILSPDEVVSKQTSKAFPSFFIKNIHSPGNIFPENCLMILTSNVNQSGNLKHKEPEGGLYIIKILHYTHSLIYVEFRQIMQ